MSKRCKIKAQLLREWKTILIISSGIQILIPWWELSFEAIMNIEILEDVPEIKIYPGGFITEPGI